MAVSGAQARLSEAMAALEGVSSHPHRFGGTEFRLGKRELGHIHGDHMVDIPFPTAVRHEVVAAGLAEPHHLLVDSGWVSLYLRQPQDVERAIELLRRNWELARKKWAPAG